MRLRAVAAAIAMMMILGACAEEGTGGPDLPGPNAVIGGVEESTTTTTLPPGVDRLIVVEAKEFAFAPPAISVIRGEVVRFQVTNIGTIEHEFRLTSRASAEARLGETSAPPADGDVVLTLQAGETGFVDVDFSERDADAVVCLIPGHYEEGMVGDLEITG